MKTYFILLSVLGFSASCFGQQSGSADSTNISNNNVRAAANRTVEAEASGPVYNFKSSISLPVLIVGGGFSVYAFGKIYNKDESTPQQIMNLNRNDIAGINRWATKYYSPRDGDLSYAFFYGAMPVPLLLMFDKKIRKDALKVNLMWLETMAVTGVMYSGATLTTDKYRPYAYNPDVPMDKKIKGGAKNSFFAGHVALIATSTFFTASVYAHYHPESKIRWLFYSAAGALTLTMAYLRLKAGEHFPTDILIGACVGTLNGLLIPSFHLNRKRDKNMSLFPYYNGSSGGVALLYRIK